MAQNVTLLGASYSNVPAVALPRTGGGTAMFYDASEIIDMFYPVGSYYETSDTTFDPNMAWGGTWSLESAGQVHVSAGTGYVAGTTGGSATTSYTPNGTVGSTTLTAAQSGVPAHGHDMSHTHRGGGNTYFVTSDDANATQSRFNNSSNGNRYVDAPSSAGKCHHYTSTATSSITTTENNTAVDATAGHDHGFTGTAASIDVMQPYVAVNRWHRTA